MAEEEAKKRKVPLLKRSALHSIVDRGKEGLEIVYVGERQQS